uniref:Uncharacterized protein n=1 Tax=Sipha flava TaxID=143950 RepID=A0A2S2QFN9_9HEMI
MEKKNQSVSVYRSTTVGVRLTHSHGPSPRGEIMPPLPPRIVNNFSSPLLDLLVYMYRCNMYTTPHTSPHVHVITATTISPCVVCKLLFFVIFRFSKCVTVMATGFHAAHFGRMHNRRKFNLFLKIVVAVHARGSRAHTHIHVYTYIFYTLCSCRLRFRV